MEKRPQWFPVWDSHLVTFKEQPLFSACDVVCLAFMIIQYRRSTASDVRVEMILAEQLRKITENGIKSKFINRTQLKK